VSRTCVLALVLASAGAVACRKTSPTESIAPTPSSSAERVPAPEPAPSPTPPALNVGPASSADREARQQAVLTLLAGELATDALPEVATEPGVPLDHQLRDRLAPVESGLASLPRGTVTVGAPEPPVSIASAARVVAGMRAGFRACYNRGLQEDPDARGVVDMVLQIGEQGEVSGAQAKPKGRLSGTVVSCVQARASAAQFDPPEGKRATLKFKLTFVPDK
jgi:hypothetical protein